MRLVVAAGLLLSALLVLFRYLILPEAVPGREDPELLGAAALGGTRDLLFVFVVVVIGLVAVRRGKPGRMFTRASLTFLLFCNVLMLLGAVNVVAVRVLGKSPAFSWISSGNVFDSPFALEPMREALTSDALLYGLGAVAAFSALSVLLAWLLRRVVRGPWRGLALAALPSLAGVALLGLAGDEVFERSERPTNLARPLGAGLQFDGKIRPDFVREVSAAGAFDAFEIKAAEPLERPARQPGQIRNVVFFVLDSVPARHVQGFGGDHPVTPNLLARAAQGIRFRNAYAHVPASSSALFSLMTGSVPEMSDVPVTFKYAEIEFAGLPAELARRGLRTGFFSSQDSRVDNTGGFATQAGVGTVRDHRDWPCEEGVYGEDRAPEDHGVISNDLCTVRALVQWIGEEPGSPFFATLWTGMTQPPHFTGDAGQAYTDDPDLDRFLDALRVGDAAFGELMAYLEGAGLMDETLVVVVGDHGQAPGARNESDRPTDLYEENLKVPLLLVNPVLFSGEETGNVAALSDIAPTVLDLLGFHSPPSWQGTSLFAYRRPDGVLFFAPWGGFQVGFREGDTKFIYNSETDIGQLFDLSADPEEQNDLAGRDPEALAAATDLLARWILAQHAWTARFLSGEEAAGPQAVSLEPPREVVLYASGTRYLTPPRAEILLDGESIGAIDVTGAPENATAPVSQEEIEAAVAPYRLTNTASPCARQMEIRFLNDEWAGDDLPGDTNLLVQAVEVGGVSYGPPQFQLLAGEAGGRTGPYFALWEAGSIVVDLLVPPACVSGALTGQ